MYNPTNQLYGHLREKFDFSYDEAVAVIDLSARLSIPAERFHEMKIQGVSLERFASFSARMEEIDEQYGLSVEIFNSLHSRFIKLVVDWDHSADVAERAICSNLYGDIPWYADGHLYDDYFWGDHFL